MASLADQIPQSVKHINKVFLLGGVTFAINQRSTLLKMLKEANFVKLMEKLEIYDVLDINWFTKSLSGLICQYVNFVCRDFLKQISDEDPILNNLERFNVILRHYPHGSSLKNI